MSRDDDWTGWCEFFLTALTKQAESNHAKARAILELYRQKKDWFAEVTRSQYAIRALDWFFSQPIFKIPDFVAASGVPERRAKRIARLARDHGLLRELSTGTGRRATTLCENCAPPPLVLGNQLLLERDPSYPVEETRKYKVREHTVGAVVEVLAELSPPRLEESQIFPEGVSTALDVFVGYVLLDAWIANQDRHHENWVALRNDVLRLAPTYDHGASLARQITDEERKDRLETRDRNRSVAYFAQKARSAFYADPADAHPLGTWDAYRTFADWRRQRGSIGWRR